MRAGGVCVSLDALPLMHDPEVTAPHLDRSLRMSMIAADSRARALEYVYELQPLDDLEQPPGALPACNDG